MVVVPTGRPEVSFTGFPRGSVRVKVTPANPGSPASWIPSWSVSIQTKLPTSTAGTIPKSKVRSASPGFSMPVTSDQLEVSTARSYP